MNTEFKFGKPLPGDLLLKWQALFDEHVKCGVAKPSKIVWETIPDIYKDKWYLHKEDGIEFLEERSDKSEGDR